MASNLVTKKGAAATGLNEIAKKLESIVNATTGAEAVEVVRSAAEGIYHQAVSNARSAKVPHQAIDDLFVYSKQPDGRKGEDSISALVGLRKAGRRHDAHGYVTWSPKGTVGKFDKTQRSKTRGRAKSLVRPGASNKIGENLGTMRELGTTKQAAQPWFRPAVSARGDAAVNEIKAGLNAVIERAAKQS